MAAYKKLLLELVGDSSVDTIPDATAFLNWTRRDTDTRKRYYSDGTNWIEFPTPSSSITTLTGNTTLNKTTHEVVMADASSAAFTITLPTASGIAGKKYTARKTDSTKNLVTIDGNSSETIGGFLTWELRVKNDYIQIVSDGTNWLIVDYSEFDISSYRRRGTTENRWYVAGQISNTALTNVATTANMIYANPLIIPRSGATISDIGINVVTGVTSTTAKIGIYKDDGNLYPGSLIYDAGSVATDTSSVFATLDVSPDLALQPGLYWIGIAINGAPTIRFVNLASEFTVLGFDNATATTGAAVGWFKSSSYPAGAMTDPFPSSASVNSAFHTPATFVRFV